MSEEQSQNGADQTPIDFLVVQRDDDLLDRLSVQNFDSWLKSANSNLDVALTRRLNVDAALDRVRTIGQLLAWRDSSDSEPIGELVSVESGLSAIESGKRRRRNWTPSTLAVVAIFSTLIIMMTGLGLASSTSEPGGWLWFLHEVLYSDGAK